MELTIFGLSALAFGVLCQRMFLRGKYAELRRREQSYRFHAIRDQVQLLVVDRVLDCHSSVFDFLMWTANVGIRNAGVLRLRDTLDLINKDLSTKLVDGILKELQQHDDRVRNLAGESFMALAEMLVANDLLAKELLKLGLFCYSSFKKCVPVAKAVGKAIRLVAPVWIMAVDRARKYHEIGAGLNA